MGQDMLSTWPITYIGEWMGRSPEWRKGRIPVVGRDFEHVSPEEMEFRLKEMEDFAEPYKLLYACYGGVGGTTPPPCTRRTAEAIAKDEKIRKGFAKQRDLARQKDRKKK